jgi:hypothetical protein
MNWDIFLVSLVLLFIIISLYAEIVGPAFTFLIGIIFQFMLWFYRAKLFLRYSVEEDTKGNPEHFLALIEFF